MQNLKIDVRAPDATEQVKAVIVAAHWEDVPPDQIVVSTISGGITNALYKVCVPSDPERLPLLIRVYGDKTEMLIDRAKDNVTFELLANKGFGVPYHGVFANGRIEGYLAARALEPVEMGQREPNDLCGKIAVEVAKLHALDMPGDRSKPVIWDFLDRWYETAAAARFDASSSDPVEGAKAAAYERVNVPAFGRGLTWLKTVLPSDGNSIGQGVLERRVSELSSSIASSGHSALCKSSTQSITALKVPTLADPVAQARVDAAAVAFSVVFAHNDLLSGNVLLSEDHHQADGSPVVPSDRVQLIDYEYAGWNYFGFDVANHWAEHCGFERYPSQYPPRELQYHWYRAYMRQRGVPVPTRATYGAAAAAAASLIPGAIAAGIGGEDDVSAAFLDELYVWTNRFAPLSDAFWGLWGVMQARYSPIDFDFISFSERLARDFRVHIHEFWGDLAPEDLFT